MTETHRVTLTVRLIKSFEYRTTKNVVLKDVDTSMTVKELKDLVRESKFPSFSFSFSSPFHVLFLSIS